MDLLPFLPQVNCFKAFHNITMQQFLKFLHVPFGISGSLEVSEGFPDHFVNFIP